jgi:hypothetical protein
MEYILLTFYNRGTTRKPIWEVYGWKNDYTNDFLDSFKTKSQAIEYAHTFSAPVLSTSKGHIIAEKLSRKS